MLNITILYDTIYNEYNISLQQSTELGLKFTLYVSIQGGGSHIGNKVI